MKTKYIIYILLALLVGFLIYNKFFSEHAKKRAAMEDKGGGGGAGGGKGEGKGKGDGKVGDAKGGGGRRNGPVAVTVMIVKDTVLNNYIDVTGTIDANERVNLISETSGRITGIYFTEGSQVKKGQLLVKVNNQDLVASLKQSQYNIALAKQNEYRNKILLQKEAISQQEYETSLTALNTLNAQADVVRAQIAKTEIRAPFSGTIGLRNVSPGGYLSPNTAIATLVNVNPAKITFSIPEKYLSLIQVGSKINFTVTSSTDNFNASVYAIEPSIDVASRTVTVRARAANPNGVLKVGGFAKINLTLDQIPKTIMVPTEAVTPDIKSSKVFLYKNGKAEPQLVKTDVRTDAKIQVVEGLKAGDSLVVSGIIQMRPKVPLKIAKVIK